MTATANEPWLDLRGLRCPWPTLRVARVMREADYCQILTDDAKAVSELTMLAARNNWFYRTKKLQSETKLTLWKA
jgi:tRNA 2-thiouridine synthesizing protein A